MIEPLDLEFDVNASPDHAFAVWTEKLSAWWPSSHTISGTRDLVMEPFAGGRIFERDDDGTEHDWGEIVTWDPPHRLRCLWHLFFDRSEATDLELIFDETPTGTRLTIRQTGWERLGPAGTERRTRTHQAWSAIGEQFRLEVDQLA